MGEVPRVPKKYMTPSLNCEDLLKSREKFSPVPYDDGTGVQTIGYGHKILYGESYTSITQQEGLDLFKSDLYKHSKVVSDYVRVPLAQGQFDCLTSFVYNLGEGTFRNSGLLEQLNLGNYNEVPNRLAKYIHPDSVSKGLKRRRLAELSLWFDIYVPVGA